MMTNNEEYQIKSFLLFKKALDFFNQNYKYKIIEFENKEIPVKFEPKHFCNIIFDKKNFDKNGRTLLNSIYNSDELSKNSINNYITYLKIIVSNLEHDHTIDYNKIIDKSTLLLSLSKKLFKEWTFYENNGNIYAIVKLENGATNFALFLFTLNEETKNYTLQDLVLINQKQKNQLCNSLTPLKFTFYDRKEKYKEKTRH